MVNIRLFVATLLISISAVAIAKDMVINTPERSTIRVIKRCIDGYEFLITSSITDNRNGEVVGTGLHVTQVLHMPYGGGATYTPQPVKCSNPETNASPK